MHENAHWNKCKRSTSRWNYCVGPGSKVGCNEWIFESFSPMLTWRDMQHIVLRTANPTPLLNNPGWSVNGVGRRISNKFGYGLMDAGAIVRLAKVWVTVPEQHMCTYEYTLSPPK